VVGPGPQHLERRVTRDHVVAVILAHEAIDKVPAVITAVHAQTVAPARILVVDNGSTDGTADWLRAQPGLHTVCLDENLGVGAGHNRGWTAARALDPEVSLVWSLEHDTIPEPACLERLLGTLEAERARVGRVAAVVPFQVRPNEHITDQGRPPFHHPTLTFNGTLLSTEAIDAAGPIREDFFVGHEDREFALRLTAAGYVILKDPGALVVHSNKGARFRARPSVLRSYYSNRNEAYLVVHVRRERMGRARVIARTVGGVGRALVREQPKGARVRSRLRATVDGLRGDLGRKHYSFLQAER
jgi:rhamnopyranosyl-N-acetylglucosaminyl-diphospho-decaprenol beta-1,3/1,4-galactofuranosyltransferase